MIDLFEAWVLLGAWILGVVGGATVGLVTAMVAERGFEGERSGGREVAAVLVTDAKDAAAPRLDSLRAWAQVRWTAADGHTHTGRTRVPSHASAGTRVSVWVNGRGDLVDRPPDRSEAMLQAAALGIGAMALVGGVVWAGARGTRALLGRRRMGQWALGRERAHTRWRGRTG